MFLALDFDNTLGVNYANEYTFHHLGRMPELLEIEALWKSDKISDKQLLTGIANLLKGVALAEIEQGAKDLRFRPHAKEFISFAKSRNLVTVVVSQDFYEMLAPACKTLGIDHVLASHLNVRDGKVTGAGNILANANDKLTELTLLANEKKLGHDFIMIGDSHGDSALFDVAALSISVGSPIAQHNVSSLLEAEKIIADFLEARK